MADDAAMPMPIEETPTEQAKPNRLTDEQAEVVFLALRQASFPLVALGETLEQYVELLERFDSIGSLFNPSRYLDHGDRARGLQEVARAAIKFRAAAFENARHLGPPTRPWDRP